MNLHYKEVMGLIPKKLSFTGFFDFVAHLTIININSGCIVMTESLQRLPYSVFANWCPWWSPGLWLLAQTFLSSILKVNS